MARQTGIAKPWGVTLVLLAAAVLAGCEKKPEPVKAPEPLVLTETSYAELPGWNTDDLSQALPALRRSCARLLGQPDDLPVGPDRLAGTVGDWRSPCITLVRSSDRDNAALRV